jgi:Rieske Fe-S protein
MSEKDKYPGESGRRRFVKGVVGSATLATVGATSASAINPMTSSTGVGGGATTFVGIRNTDGPAPRGMPMIPVRIDDNGDLLGYWPEEKEAEEAGRTVTVAREQLGGQTYSSEWFQYCGVETYPGVQPAADEDNYFRYPGGSPYEWQENEVEAGDIANVSDFSDYETWANDIGPETNGKPATVTWRSQNASDEKTMPVQVLRIPPDRFRQAKNSASGAMESWLEAATPDGDTFVAWLNKCTHFCCVPGFKSLDGSASFGAENEVYCQCHQSVYDPFSPTERQYTAFPRPRSE